MASRLSGRLRRLVPAVAVATGLGWAAAPVADAAPAAVTTPGTISTVAGGVGGPAKATTVALGTFGSAPCGAAYGHGSLYVADTYTVRKVDPQTDGLTTPAGAGTAGPRGNGGPAASAYLESCNLGVDRHGNLVVADWINQQVQVVAAVTGTFYGKAMTAGHIYRVAGTGSAGYSGNGGPATKAELAGPEGVALDSAGNLVIADTGNERVRVVAARTGTFYGKAMIAGDIYKVAGSGQVGYSGNGGSAVKAAFNGPRAVAVDSAGNLVIADFYNNRVRVVAARAGTFYGKAMTAGDIYSIAGGGTGQGDGGPGTKASLNRPPGVAVDAAGNAVIPDVSRVRVVAAATGTFYGQPMTAGDIYTVAGDGDRWFYGDGGPATRAGVNPAGVGVDGAGNLVIADGVETGVRVVAAATGTFYGQPMTAGDIYTIAGDGDRWYSGDGGPAVNATLSPAFRVAADAAGNVVIADESDGRVRVAAAATGTFYGQPMTAGSIYTIAGNGQAGFSGDGGPATEASFWGPDDVAIDSSGNLVITDYLNNRVRVVAAATGTFYGQAMTAGDIYTVAGNGTFGFSGDGGPAASAELGQPEAVAVDAAGNLVIADTFNHRVRVLAAATGTFYGQPMTAGDIYTIGGNGTAGFSGDGGPATGAELHQPGGTAVDAAGNLLIADTASNRVRVVAAATGSFYGQAMTAGDIYTIAGGGTTGLGDRGPASKAQLHQPAGMTVDGAGNLLIADTSNGRVRVVAAATGSFYGQAMTAGDIYTIAGGGTTGVGDGGPATSAGLGLPSDVALTSTGNLLIADTGHERVRMVAG